MKSLDARRAVAYLRVSTDRQELGPEAQRAAIVAWAAREGVVVVAWHTDTVSGAAPIDARPALLAALDALSTDAAGVLVVSRRDRLARDVVASAMIERLATRKGATVASADGTGNGTGPEAEMMRGILAVFAQYERQIIRGRTRAALQAKRARGERAGTVPYGCTADAAGVLSPNAGEVAVQARVRAMRAAGVPLRAIVSALASAEIVGRTGRPLALAQVARIARVA